MNGLTTLGLAFLQLIPNCDALSQADAGLSCCWLPIAILWASCRLPAIPFLILFPNGLSATALFSLAVSLVFCLPCGGRDGVACAVADSRGHSWSSTMTRTVASFSLFLTPTHEDYVVMVRAPNPGATVSTATSSCPFPIPDYIVPAIIRPTPSSYRSSLHLALLYGLLLTMLNHSSPPALRQPFHI